MPWPFQNGTLQYESTWLVELVRSFTSGPFWKVVMRGCDLVPSKGVAGCRLVAGSIQSLD